jgi:hypothetical protein
VRRLQGLRRRLQGGQRHAGRVQQPEDALWDTPLDTSGKTYNVIKAYSPAPARKDQQRTASPS